ncbi:MAG TPA: aminotransferase class III-fold pyridoxal phosphate-dependent enzyme [Roseiflexaceae bacterium]|nr:aminotransferase class III-fold pyridoxal phosphate-dependent enzyme [Roseiflexaceae bacterium]HMP41287.1 aminotransferase class III-fold pyridoxal phosphate-dependent enzyme [Roseiflexaceae bacterium]
MSLLDNTADLAPAWARYNEILVERGEGACLYDVNGRHYLDFTCGIGVTNTGHCHPRVVEAIREQAGLLLHGQANIVYHKPMLQLVESLRAVLPASLDTFFFSNSGAEAIEGAVKLARQVSGRSSIIAFEGGFHGRTAGAMALTSSKGKYRAGHAPLPAGVYTAPYAHCYGCAVAAAAGRDTSAISRAAPLAECCGEPLRRLEHMLHTQIAPEDVAAMVVEPVIGEGGYIVPPASFLQGLRRICDQHGILLIVDEVQTGFGRTGSFFAFEQFGITPDILVIAKGLASGLPLSGIIARREIMGRWRPGSHGGTYGGNAVACAAAVATIAAIREEGMVERAALLGRQLIEGLDGIRKATPAIGDVRGLGLMVGVELIDEQGAPDAALARHTLERCREHGLLLLTCGPYDNVVRFIPPLIVSEAQIREALQIFAAALQG